MKKAAVSGQRPALGERLRAAHREAVYRAMRIRRRWARWVRRVWNRIVDGAGDLLDRIADRVEGRPAWDMCGACGRSARVLYLMPTPIDGAVDRRCDTCRETWHQAIRDYYAHRAAEQAAARYDRERKEAA